MWQTGTVTVSSPPLIAGRPADCHTSVTGGTLDTASAERLAHIFKAIGDPTRVRLLSLIADSGEACVCELTEPVGLTQPTVSHHMRQLVEAGLVTREQRGKWAYYRVVEDTLRSAALAITPVSRERP